MIRLNSIEKIDAANVFKTGCTPVLVHCDDLKFYLCKYNTGNTSADKLLREYLGNSFLKIWGILTPECNLVTINIDHLPPGIGITSININCPCFGSCYNREYKEIDKFIGQISDYQIGRFVNPEEFLDIAFFDIWVANDDRHLGNYNLFIFDENGKQHFVAYDHEAIFNMGNLHRGLIAPNAVDSILSSPLLFELFTVKELQNKDYLDALLKKWYICIGKCRESIRSIFEVVPDEWKIDKKGQIGLLEKNLFSDEWFKECERSFLEILQVNLNKKE